MAGHHASSRAHIWDVARSLALKPHLLASRVHENAPFGQSSLKTRGFAQEKALTAGACVSDTLHVFIIPATAPFGEPRG